MRKRASEFMELYPEPSKYDQHRTEELYFYHDGDAIWGEGVYEPNRSYPWKVILEISDWEKLWLWQSGSGKWWFNYEVGGDSVLEQRMNINIPDDKWYEAAEEAFKILRWGKYGMRKKAYGRGVTDDEFDELESYIMTQYGAAHDAMIDAAQAGLEYFEPYFEGKAEAYSDIITYIDTHLA